MRAISTRRPWPTLLLTGIHLCCVSMTLYCLLSYDNPYVCCTGACLTHMGYEAYNYSRLPTTTPWFPVSRQPALQMHRNTEGKWVRGFDETTLRTRDGRPAHSVFAPTQMEVLRAKRDKELHSDRPSVTTQLAHDIYDFVAAKPAATTATATASSTSAPPPIASSSKPGQ